MRYYPLLVNLSKMRVLLVGAGEVGQRKATGILACKPEELLWLDPAVSINELPVGLNTHMCLRYEQRTAVAEDIAGRQLVFAASGSREANHMLHEICQQAGVLCNIADTQTEGSFIVPAHFYDNGLLLALSTGGKSPALARRIRRELQEQVSIKYGKLLKIMEKLRPIILIRGETSSKNTALFRAIANSNLAELLASDDLAGARNVLLELLPETLHPHIGELLNDSL